MIIRLNHSNLLPRDDGERDRERETERGAGAEKDFRMEDEVERFYKPGRIKRTKTSR